MITMIVMVITTTLSEIVSDSDFYSGLFSGCISGVVVTFLTWFVVNRLLAPHINISRDIAYAIVDDRRDKKDAHGKTIRDEKGNPVKEVYKATVYRFKIENTSLRDAFDINIFVRIRYKTQYAIIRLPYQPFLNRRRWRPLIWIKKLSGKYNETYEHHRLVPFRMTDIRLKKIEGFKSEENLIKKHKNGELNLDDFKHDDTIVEIIVMAVDSMSGSALRVRSQLYTQSDLNRHVKEGEFLDGEMFVRAKDEKKKTATT